MDAFLEFLLVRQADVFSVGGAAKRSPHIGENEIFVEDREVMSVSGMSASKRLLLWAAMFPVYNQKLPSSSAKNAVIVLTEEVFRKPSPGQTLKNRSRDRLTKLKSAC